MTNIVFSVDVEVVDLILDHLRCKVHFKNILESIDPVEMVPNICEAACRHFWIKVWSIRILQLKEFTICKKNPSAIMSDQTVSWSKETKITFLKEAE